MLGHRFLGQTVGRHDQQPAPHLERGLERGRQPLFDPGSCDQPVDHDFDRVLPVLVQRRQIRREFDEFAVDARAQKALADHLLELAAVLALLAPDVGSEKQQARALRQRGNPIHHLLHRLGPDLRAALRAVGYALGGVQQPQVVLDLGDRADR